jgi:hypothetical protein
MSLLKGQLPPLRQYYYDEVWAKQLLMSSFSAMEAFLIPSIFISVVIYECCTWDISDQVKK